MAPKTAILLAAYDGKLWIEEQVRSILGQIGADIHLFISVDQSTDGTEMLVEKLAKQDPRIQVLPLGNHFGSAARNFFYLITGINLSDYEFIALADQDDIWLPNKLSSAISTIKDKHLQAYSGNSTAFWSNGKRLLINKAQPQVEWDFLFEAAGPGCTYVFTQAFSKKLQEFIRSNWEQIQLIHSHDWLIYAFARANQIDWYIDPHTYMLYRQHQRNEMGVNHGMLAFMSRAKKVLSGWGLSQSLLIAKTVGLMQNSFVQSWSSGSRLSYLYLAFKARKCRRRIKDQAIFCLACLALCLIKPPIS